MSRFNFNEILLSGKADVSEIQENFGKIEELGITEQEVNNKFTTNLANYYNKTNIDNLLGNKLNKVTFVTTANTNLNDYKDDGIYYFESDVTPVNIPIGLNGWLIVFNRGKNKSFVKQIWLRQGTPGTNDMDTYIRTLGSSWGAWRKVLMDSQIINNLTDSSTDKPLSANQGKVLKTELDKKAVLLNTLQTKGEAPSNLNNLSDTGIYYVGETAPTNAPANFGGFSFHLFTLFPII
jgi:hypothetical protein